MNFNWVKLFDKYAIWLIISIAIFLRFWNLGITPPSLYWDEVSQGYNSYSILKTGFDEHHEFFPIARFQAFGDYKAPVYIYLDVIPIALFGQTEFAVRFPSAFFGVLTVLLTYFLTREIFIDHKSKRSIAIFSSLFLALSPWHIQLSRVAYEANIATFFTVLGLWLFFVAKRKQSYIFILCSLSFVMAFYAFNAHRVFVPLLVMLLLFIFRKELFRDIQKIIFSGLIALILLLPFIFYLKTPESKLRFSEVNIFTDISVVKESNKLMESDNNSIVGNVLHNRRVLYGLSYVKHYFDFFNPSYLFLKGDVNPRFSTQETGELYLYMLPLILLGIYGLIKKPDKNSLFLFGWFLLAPIAAATARETPHALRSETYIPIYEIFGGIGIVWFINRLMRFGKTIKITTILFFATIVIYYLVDFLHVYYVHMPYKYSQDWQYGYKQTVEKVEAIKNNYDEIIFSNAYGRAYIYVLWYGKYNPQTYWKQGEVTRDVFGFYNVNGFGKYTFKSPMEKGAYSGRKILFVGQPSEIASNLRIVEKIKFLDGSDAFIIADNL